MLPVVQRHRAGLCLLVLLLAALLLGAGESRAAATRVTWVQPAMCGTGKLTLAQRTRDTDRDRRPNWRDSDVDGDGIRNGRDRNVDGDRRGNRVDRDVDGDGILNRRDRDVDGDGVRNDRDRDVDGDRILNGADPDVDGDGIPNATDPDIDGDCTPNGRDRDSDGDGIEDPLDIQAYGAGGSLRVAASAVGRVPASFFGFVANEAAGTSGAAQARVLAEVRGAGAGLLRQKLDWATIERSPGQYDFRFYDGFVLAVARAGIQLLPILFNPPAFHSSDPGADGTAPPRANADFARFAEAAVRRYGPGGSLWAQHPEVAPVPVTAWQVWNEPNFRAYWPSGPSPAAYTAMLRTVGQAIHAADPGAEVVAAGLPDTYSGMSVADYLQGMYAAGAKGAFDTMAIHPYARSAEQTIEILNRARTVMNRNGDPSPIRVTEFGWATTSGDAQYEVGHEAQAALIRRVLRTLVLDRARLNLRGVVYYAWQDAHPYVPGRDFWGLHTGLHELDGAPKPGLAAFAQTAAELTQE